MTTDRAIKKENWKEFFNFISKNIAGEEVELEIAGLDIGDQVEKDWLPVEGFSFEPREDILYFHTISLDHSIHSPREIIANEDGPLLHSILIKDGAENLQIIKFRHPLKLNSPPRWVPRRETQNERTGVER